MHGNALSVCGPHMRHNEHFQYMYAQPPKHLKDYVVGTMQDFDQVPCMEACFKLSVDMQLSTDALRWKEAMDSEYQSLVDNETWTLEPLSDVETPIRGKWVYTYKTDHRCKAGFVAQGFTQTKGVNSEETFAPTVRMSTLCTFQCAVNHDWHVSQCDVKTAYLNAPFDYPVFIH